MGCHSCACLWAKLQAVERGVVQCPACACDVPDEILTQLLDSRTLSLLRVRESERKVAQDAQSKPVDETMLGIEPGHLARLGVKRCPQCGTGVQREVETCHKMICRTCRSKFCFRCL